MITPVVADMAHFNTVDFHKIAAAGIVGVIHKATQGLGVVDHQYAPRRALAVQAGLLWGAYDFATGDNAVANAKQFLGMASPDDATLVCLDFEDNAKSPMSGQQAHDFMDAVDQAIGRACWIYGGNRIFEHVTPLCQNSSAMADFFSRHPLWLCQYKTGLPDGISLDDLNKHIRIPAPWKAYSLLQYTGDGVGPKPHSVDGLEQGADLNAFDGEVDELKAIWAGTAFAAAAP